MTCTTTTISDLAALLRRRAESIADYAASWTREPKCPLASLFWRTDVLALLGGSDGEEIAGLILDGKYDADCWATNWILDELDYDPIRAEYVALMPSLDVAGVPF